MRTTIRKHIPSMFERRLLMLLGIAIAVSVVLLLRTAQLTSGETHRTLSEEAERVLYKTTYIPTVRGAILDRHNRPLAVDSPGFDVAVSYDVLSGEWPYDQARRVARRAHRELWYDLSDTQREAIIARHQEPFDHQVEELYRTFTELGRNMQGLDDPDILEQRRNAIVARVQATWSDVTLRAREKRMRELSEHVTWVDANTIVAEQTQKHALLLDVNEQVRTIIEGFIADAERAADANTEQAQATAIWREVAIVRPKHRKYPYETIEDVEIDMSTMPPDLRSDTPMTVKIEGVATHILGLMRDVQAEDLDDPKRRPFVSYTDDDRVQINLDGYRDGDQVGSTGIEATMETHLRGIRGKSVRRRDLGTEERIEPIPGRDVHLTIDIALQAQLQALLQPEVGLTVVQPYHKSKAVRHGELGKQLTGAAVVLDVETSEVLAAASFPAMPMRMLKEDPDWVYRNPALMPYINRTVASKYNPGSIIKAVILTSATTAGRHALHDPIYCNGILDPKHPNQFRCWIFKRYMSQHGPVDAPMSLEVSCNIYYYTIGRAMGVERTVDWYSRYGLGELTGCGLLEEVTGSLPDPKTGSVSDAINMAIGQGPVAWTPLQAASAYATLARSGVKLNPTFIMDRDRDESRRRTDLNLDQAAVRAAMRGLADVTTGADSVSRWLDRGAGEAIINATGLTVYSKSGTADPGRRWIDHNVDGNVDPGEVLDEDQTDDHSWFVVMVKPDGASRPTHVIAVVTEYAGSGSRVSGPITNQIIHLMQRGGWL